MGFKIAVIGAADSLGREILEMMAERRFPADEVIALGTGNTAGREVSYGEDEVLRLQSLEQYDFAGTHIAFFAEDPKTSAKFAPVAAKAGCVAIDCTTHFRMEPGVPLVVPEVNPEDLGGFRKRNIVASPGAATVQLVTALSPIHERFTVRRAVVSTYQPASTQGKQGMDELFTQTRGIYVNEPPSKTQEVFPKQIAFNVIPQVAAFAEEGATREERDIAAETRKVLDPDVRVHANCAQVPVFIGVAQYVNVETEAAITDAKAREVLKGADGVTVIDHRQEEGYVTPAEVSGEDSVYVSRIRKDESVDSGVSFWVAGDNLRKGGALNAVAIAELLIREHLSH